MGLQVQSHPFVARANAHRDARPVIGDVKASEVMFASFCGDDDGRPPRDFFFLSLSGGSEAADARIDGTGVRSSSL